jgi:hypothetical protein
MSHRASQHSGGRSRILAAARGSRGMLPCIEGDEIVHQRLDMMAAVSRTG